MWGYLSRIFNRVFNGKKNTMEELSLRRAKRINPI
jgi:hypothetical protein